MTVCWDCGGTRSVPYDHAEGGYGPCPVCVIDAGETFVEWPEELGTRWAR